jgi:hypothetical protein
VRIVVVEREVEAPVEAVASVLADPRVYDRMVVGSRRIRWFDPRWPATGTRFRHAVGFGPLTVPDQSEVLAGELPDRLALAVGLGPAGVVRVELLLRPAGTGDRTRVQMAEEPLSGPLVRVWRGPVARLARRRSVEALRRLGALAAARARVQSLDPAPEPLDPLDP